MSAQREEVAVELADAHRHVRDALGGVDEDGRAHLPRAPRQFLDRVDDADAVGHVNRRQQLQARGEELVEARHVQAVVAFEHGQDAQLRAGVPRDLLPRDEVGVVFVGGDDYLVSLADVLPRPRVRH